MSVHDWTRVDAGIYHAFRHSWVEELKRALNGGILPQSHYALAERLEPNPAPDFPETAETDMEFYRRKQSAVVVRHVSGDRMVAVVEAISPGNKAGRAALRSLVEKAAVLLDNRIHLLILDLHPPTPRDPQGIHGAIWEEVSGEEYAAPPGKPLTLAAYESGLTLRAYVEPVSVGDALIPMPLFLEPGAHVPAPLETTYQRAFAALPARWRVVLEKG